MHPSLLKDQAVRDREATVADVAAWWDANPMAYDWRDPIAHPKLSQKYFDELDRRFFDCSWFAQEPGATPFSRYMDFAKWRGKRVLEIGCGLGTHAQLLAQAGCDYTGIDLSAHAAAATRRRLELRGLPGTVLQMDATRMEFEDESFDAVWSWGVIHHSPTTEIIAREILRVLKPGGDFVVMVYHKNSFVYWLNYFFVRGVLMGKLLTMSMEQIRNRYSDGLIARFFTRAEGLRLFAEASSATTEVAGLYTELLPLPRQLRDPLTALIPRAVKHWLLRRGGWFLIIKGEKQ